MNKKVVFFLFLISAVALPLASQVHSHQYNWSKWNGLAPPRVEGRSAVLLDYSTGALLYAKAPDLTIPPASLTKLVTAHILLREVNGGIRTLSDEVEIPPEAWAVNMPRGSSLMFLGPKDNVTIKELLSGLLVSSGNDAAQAIALILSGSLREFTERMNSEMEAMGFPDMHFEDASGLSPKSKITASDFAEFCRIYIREHGEYLKDFHALREFTYPKAKNRPSDERVNSITQYNRNLLLWEYEGADGLKTGFIDESGYNVAVTAERENTRLIAVVLGIEAKNHEEGGLKRKKAGATLLDFGFENFVTLSPDSLPLSPVKVWKGKEKEVEIEPEEEVVITVPKKLSSRLANRIELPEHHCAPIQAGQELGSLSVFSGDLKIREFPLTAAGSVEEGSWIKRLFDSAAMFFLRVEAAGCP
jgi:serine-type D-Ala-D-Ala carboxypeptidase (penicillin-binding protein 5/6)